jgi:hypothetical protein
MLIDHFIHHHSQFFAIFEPLQKASIDGYDLNTPPQHDSYNSAQASKASHSI